jgi:hypothetical protein
MRCAYSVTAGHKGHPEVVAREGRTGKLRGKSLLYSLLSILVASETN